MHVHSVLGWIASRNRNAARRAPSSPRATVRSAEHYDHSGVRHFQHHERAGKDAGLTNRTSHFKDMAPDSRSARHHYGVWRRRQNRLRVRADVRAIGNHLRKERR